MIRASDFKNIRLWPIINNAKAFIFEHPELHPESSAYIKYWKEQKKRCIEGFWANDSKDESQNWRYASGPLYWYANMWTIKMQDKEQKSEYYTRPLLRDNEWIVFNAILAAQGFSGFEGDDNFTCHRLVKKFIDEKNGVKDKNTGILTKMSKLELRELENSNNLYKQNGELKEYVEAYEFLKRTHDKPLGKPLYENSVKNLLFLSGRGQGKSFQISSIGGHEFTFDGLKHYDQSKNTKLQSGVFVGAADGDKSTDLITKIKDGLEALPGSYGEGDEYIPSPFFKQTRGSFNEGEFIEHAYKVNAGGEWKWKGSRSKIYHGNFGHDTHDAVGKRLTKIFVEEIGELDKVETIHSANERTMKIGGNKFGMEFCIGTGGNVKYTAGLKKLYYNPNQYDYYPFQDYWENSGDVGLFIPATYCYNEFKDENGNTDLESALDVCVETRNEKAKADTTAPLDFEMMYSPLKISEIFLNPNTNIFPISLIRNRQTELEIRNLFKAKAQFGELEWTTNGDVRWMPDMSLKPITSYYVDERFDLRSCIVIYEHPGDYIKPQYRRSLIKIGYDLVGSEGGGSSLASILVYKGLPDILQDPSEMRNTIVAEYIGRHNNVDNIHEIAIKLAKYYGAKILYEDNIPGFLTYCRQKGFLDYLQPSPNVALGEIYKGDFKKNKFGIKMTKQLIDAADLKTRSWMMTPISHDTEGLIEKFNIDSIYSPRFLDEYTNFDGLGNFDHISTFRIIQLWLMDEVLQPIGTVEEIKRENELINSVLQRRESKINKLITY